MYSKSRGFSLLELMTAFVVVAVLAIVGVPSYREYVMMAKMAEAIQNVGVISKAETIFYVENKEFRFLYRNPLYPPGADNGIYTIQNRTDLVDLNSPLTPGARTYFAYYVYTGLNDASGTPISRVDGTYGRTQASVPIYWRAELSNDGATLSGTCGNTVPAGDLYRPQISGGPNYAAGVILAAANFHDTNETFTDNCAYAAQGLSTINGEIRKSPIIMVKENLQPVATSSTTASSSSSSSSSSSATDSSGDSRDTTSESTTDTTGEDSRDATSGDSRDAGTDSK